VSPVSLLKTAFSSQLVPALAGPMLGLWSLVSLVSLVSFVPLFDKKFTRGQTMPEGESKLGPNRLAREIAFSRSASRVAFVTGFLNFSVPESIRSIVETSDPRYRIVVSNGSTMKSLGEPEKSRLLVQNSIAYIILSSSQN
jgi:hypothetical protein